MPYFVFSEHYSEDERPSSINSSKERTELPVSNDTDDSNKPPPPYRNQSEKSDTSFEEYKQAVQMNIETQQQKLQRLKAKTKRHEGLRSVYSNDVVHHCSTLDECYYHFQAGNEEAQGDRHYRNRSQTLTKAVREEKQREREGKGEKKSILSQSEGPKTRGGAPEAWKSLKKHLPVELRSLMGWEMDNSPETKVGEADNHLAHDSDEEPYWPILRVNQIWFWEIGESRTTSNPSPLSTCILLLICWQSGS